MVSHAFHDDGSDKQLTRSVSLQATQAYLVGNKALAKELGAKGRHHSDEMKAAHAAASESIFQQRNMRNASSAVSNKNGAPIHIVSPCLPETTPRAMSNTKLLTDNSVKLYLLTHDALGQFSLSTSVDAEVSEPLLKLLLLMSTCVVLAQLLGMLFMHMIAKDVDLLVLRYTLNTLQR